VNDFLDGRLGIDFAANAHQRGHRPDVGAKRLFAASALVLHQIVTDLEGALEPMADGFALFLPIAPSDVVGGAQMGVHQRFLGRHANGRMRTARKRIGGLHGLGVERQGLAIIGLRAGSRQIAHQTERFGPDVRLLLAGLHGAPGILQRLRKTPNLGQHLGSGQAIVRRFGIEPNGLVGRADGLLILLHRRQRAAAQPVGPRVVRLQFDRLLGVETSQFAVVVQRRLGAKHERLGRNRL